MPSTLTQHPDVALDTPTSTHRIPQPPVAPKPDDEAPRPRIVALIVLLTIATVSALYLEFEYGPPYPFETPFNHTLMRFR